MTTIGSVRFPDCRLRLYPLADLDGPGRFLIHGPALLKEAERHVGLSAMPNVGDIALIKAQPEYRDVPLETLKLWYDDFRSVGGFHIDMASKAIDFWTARDAAGIPGRIVQSWPGWTVHWHRDQFESQIDLTRGALGFALPAHDILSARLIESLLDESTFDPCGALGALWEVVEEQGSERVECAVTKSWVLENRGLKLPLAERMRILAHALAEVHPGRTWRGEFDRLAQWLADRKTAEQEDSTAARPSGDPVADAFEARLLEWLQSTVGTTPPSRRSRCPAMTPDQGINVGYWELEYEGSKVELVVVGRRGVLDLPLREGIDWIVRVDEREPAPFISRLEAEFLPARRIPRRMYGDMIRQQFKSTELRPDSALAAPPHSAIPGELR